MANVNEFSQPIKLLNGGPLDALRGPYATVADACAAIPNVADSSGNNYRLGKIVDIGTSGIYNAYAWVFGDYSDAGLKPVVSQSFSPEQKNAISSSALFKNFFGASSWGADQVSNNFIGAITLQGYLLNHQLIATTNWRTYCYKVNAGDYFDLTIFSVPGYYPLAMYQLPEPGLYNFISYLTPATTAAQGTSTRYKIYIPVDGFLFICCNTAVGQNTCLRRPIISTNEKVLYQGNIGNATSRIKRLPLSDKVVSMSAMSGIFDGYILQGYKLATGEFSATVGSFYQESAGSIITSSNFSYYVKQVVAGEKFEIRTFEIPDNYIATLFSSNTFISANKVTSFGQIGQPGNNTTKSNIRITIPSDGYLLINHRTATSKDIAIGSYAEEISTERLLSSSDLIASLDSDTLFSQKTGTVPQAIDLYSRIAGEKTTDARDVKNAFARTSGGYYNYELDSVTSSSSFEYYLKSVTAGEKYVIQGYGTSDMFPALLLSSTTINRANVIQTFGAYAVTVPDTPANRRFKVIFNVPSNGYLLIQNRSGTGVLSIYSLTDFDLSVPRITSQSDLLTSASAELLRAQVISNWKHETVAHVINIAQKGGDMFIAYYSSDVATVESPTSPGMKTILGYYNICDPGQITYIEALKMGETVGSFTQAADYAPYDPLLFATADGNLQYLQIVKNANSSSEGTQIAARKFNTSTKTWIDSEFTFCDLTYNSTTVKLSETGLKSFCTDVLGYTPATVGYPILNGSWRLFNSEYYTVLGSLGNGQNGVPGMVVKTTDGIHYTYVTSIPTGRKDVWEGECALVGCYLYVVVRGSSKLYRYNLITKAWVTGVQDAQELEQPGRPAIFYKDNKLYIMYNALPDATKARSRFRISVIDLHTLAPVKSQDIVANWTFQYPQVYKSLNSNWYLAYTEDRRGTETNGRGNISILPLDKVVKI